jgi:hypothetical protein
MVVGAHRHLKVVVQAWAPSPVKGGGADVGPRRWLKVRCGYGHSSLFEGADAGVRRCLRVLVQVWALVAVER